MLKKTIRRLGALAMVLAMAVSVFAVNASATEVTVYPETDTAVITKQITKEANVLAPNGNSIPLRPRRLMAHLQMVLH